MKIRTQFIITIVLFGLMTAVIAVSAIFTNQRVERARQQERLANGVAHGANELTFLSVDYLIYRESQQLSRWQSRYDSFSADVDALRIDTPEQQALVESIRSNQSRMKEVFDGVVAAAGAVPGTDAGEASFDRFLLQAGWSRMAVQSQGLSSDASMLSQKMSDEADTYGRINTYVIFSMIAVFGAYFLLNYILLKRRTLGGLDRLQADTAIIGSGKLDHVIDESRNDEIGDLSRAFNRMTGDLRGVTASRDELEQEIRERKNAEALLQRALATVEKSNDELQQFAYVASHDLKEPLRTVSSYMQLLKRRYGQSFDADAADFIDFSVDATQRMETMIDDLLSYSRVGTHGRPFENVDAGEILNQALGNLAESIKQRGAEVSAGPLPQVMGDRTQMIILFQNLIANAIKFNAGTPRIQISAEPEDGKWRFAIKDNGLGIDTRYQDRIFTIFQRLHNRQEYPGTGIGLAVCKKIVERHGGTIGVESEPGRGSTFFFTLPGADQAASPAAG